MILPINYTQNLLENIDPGLERPADKSGELSGIPWMISKSKHAFINFLCLEYKITLFHYNSVSLVLVIFAQYNTNMSSPNYPMLVSPSIRFNLRPPSSAAEGKVLRLDLRNTVTGYSQYTTS